MNRVYGILFSIILIGVFSLSSMAQIPNAGMENWSNGSPTDWLTNNIPTIPPVIPVTQSSDAHSGNSSAHLEILSSSLGPYPAELFAGSDGNGFPTTQRYAYVTGYYKFMPADPLDVLQVYAQVWEGTNFLGAASYPITAAATTWTQFMAPISYFLPGTPDRCKVDFVLSTGSGTVGGVALIDDLEFSGVNAIGVIDNGQIPSQFELKQNYPNPFNPATNIEFSIPQTADVKLVVYNQLGQTVATLVNKRLSSGSYFVDWNAEGLPSGIYFYRIISGNFAESRKMILMQ